MRTDHPVWGLPVQVMASEGLTGERYVITIRGVAGPSVRAAFDDVELTVLGDRTVLQFPGIDQAALYGLLHRIQDLGLEVVEMHQEPGGPT